MSHGVRAATPEDARRIAEVHVAARRAAYRGLIPGAQLAAESVEERTGRWTDRLSDRQGRCWLMTDPWGLLGFAYTAPSRNEGLAPATAELFSIYLLPSATGRGLGRLLTEHALEDLKERGFSEVVLWYAQENVVAGRFYAAAGFVPDERVATIPFGDTGLTKRRLRRPLC